MIYLPLQSLNNYRVLRFVYQDNALQGSRKISVTYKPLTKSTNTCTLTLLNTLYFNCI